MCSEAARVDLVGRTLLLLANPNASGVRGRDDVERARRLLERPGARVEVRLTDSAEELAASFDPDDCDRRIVLLGGDGTLHAVANLFPCPRHEIALLPAGGANNVARSLGIPRDLRAAAELAVAGAARSLDRIACAAGERRYAAIEGVSVGFHALARARYRAESSTAVGPALLAGLAVLATFRPPCVEVESDGELVAERMDQLFVANLPRYAFGLRVAPDADPADGLADLVAIRRTGRLSLLAMLARLRRGTHLGREEVRAWRASRIRIDTGGRSPVICDSTNVGAGPVELEVERDALAVVAPPS